jgi:glycosyltransferase involved in cell wall biosynthesis
VIVGIVTDFYFPWIGGPAGAIRSLGRGLVERGHEVALLAPSPHGRFAVENDGGMTVTRVPTVRAPVGYNLRVALPPRGVNAWLDHVQPDVVQIHHPFPLSAAAAFAARKRTIPIVATNHTIPECSLWGLQRIQPAYRSVSWAFGGWLRRVLGSADIVTTPTSTAAAMLQNVGYRGVVRVISNGMDTMRFAPGPADEGLRARLGLDKCPAVLYTGRLDPEKEMGNWLRAAAGVAKRTDVQFIVGGEGTDRERLETLARDLGIEDRCHFVGYVSDSELPSLYRLADIYMMLAPVELQSISTLEAMATGLPVVAVEAGALPELVEPGRNGYLVEPGDWRSASDALATVLQDSALREMMGQASRRVARSHDLARTITAYEQVFEEARAARGDRRVERAAGAG